MNYLKGLLIFLVGTLASAALAALVSNVTSDPVLPHVIAIGGGLLTGVFAASTAME